MRVQKTENGATTWYLRSTVLGGQVVAEFTGNTGASNTWQRGYIYTGGQLLAIQEVAVPRVLWVHQEPYSKGQRLTDADGAIVSRLEFDPFGGAVGNNLAHTPSYGWTVNDAVQKRKYTSYERDANGGDEAHFRRYEKNWSRFSQPDPYDGSVSLVNPQTLNRYTYTTNDPINSTDPLGLCTININFGTDSRIDREAREAIEKEIKRIFGAAKLTVQFGNSIGAIKSFQAQFTKPSKNSSNNALASTNVNKGQVENNTRLFLERINFAEERDPGLRLLGNQPNNLGRALGRIIAHEAGHYLLNINTNNEHPTKGLMRAQFKGDRKLYQDDDSQNFLFTEEEVTQLQKLCDQQTNGTNGAAGGGAGTDGHTFLGGSYPSWWYSLHDFLHLLNSIPVDRDPPVRRY